MPSDDFPVEWPDPADLQLTWEFDDMHAPQALAPLAADYMAAVAQGVNPSYEYFGSRMRVRFRSINGYGYFAWDFGVPEAEVGAAWEQLKDARRSFAPDTSRYWAEEAIPTLRRIYTNMAAIDADGGDGAELAMAWTTAWADLVTAWTIHMIAIRGAYQVEEDLADLYEAAVPDASPGEALRLLQAGNNVLQEVEAGIERLAALAADRPAVVGLLASTHPSLEELEAVRGGAEVGSEIRAFLEEHGHLGQAFDDLTLPSWSEEPSIFLAELGHRIERDFRPDDGEAVTSPGSSPGSSRGSSRGSRAGSGAESSADRRARLRDEATRLAATVRERLADRPAELERFQRTLVLATEIGPLTETHNYWIDRMAQARLRQLATRVGARLVRDGVTDLVDDVFFLRADEVAAVLREPADRRELVHERRLAHVRNLALRPPLQLGKPEVDVGISSRFDQERPDPLGPDELKGIGASAGRATGPARVVLHPDDFGRVRPGDIIVCPSSNPSWIPVFAIAGGLVVNTGGVLSHAAVVAREFGLPAVVGTGDATTRIADGRIVEIDGAAGTVKLR